MFEYRVEKCAVRNAEAEMNRMAADGWRVVAVVYNQATYGIIVTYERKKKPAPAITETGTGF